MHTTMVSGDKRTQTDAGRGNIGQGRNGNKAVPLPADISGHDRTAYVPAYFERQSFPSQCTKHFHLW